MKDSLKKIVLFNVPSDRLIKTINKSTSVIILTNFTANYWLLLAIAIDVLLVVTVISKNHF